jgi:hypothetical protein
MVFILCQRRRGPHAQLFQPFSQFLAASLASHTVLTIRPVDSQKEQQPTDPASKIHDPPRQPRSEPS